MQKQRRKPRARLLPSSDSGQPTAKLDRQRIESYGDGGFRISGVRHAGSVIVLPEATLAWVLEDPAELTIESLAPVCDLEAKIDIILFGSGRSLAPVDARLRAALRELGIVIEPMDTGAACRTYSVLAAEERRVAAALIAID